MNENGNIIEFKEVTVTYANGFCAARYINFAVEAGECLAIVGESGSGKSTIARAALGLLPATAKVSGSIRVGETEITGASKRSLRKLRGRIAGFIAQDPFAACNPLLRVKTHIAEAWYVHALKPSKNFIVNSLENLGIENAAFRSQKYPHEWSGGMMQRAEIIAATALRPALIIADEPTSALDANRADEVLLLLRQTNAAILLVSHDLNLVARHAHRIAVCYKGEIVEIGEARQIVESPQHFYTKVLIDAVPREKLFSAFKKTGEIVLEGKNLSRFYGRGESIINAVVEANLKVRGGEIIGISGESGCGKSTLLRLLATIETPSTGEVFLDGKSQSQNRTFNLFGGKALKGFVMPIFQDPLASLDLRWSIWRTVTEPLMAKHLRKPTTKRRREIARKILAKVNLKEINLDAKPLELSVGQCQRIAIARALAANPKLIIADEPTSALDATVSKTILQLLAQIAASGTAIVIVSHDEKMLRTVCHRVLRMRKGILLN